MPLPPGLILNPQTGELTGLPTQAGTYIINLEVRDALGNRREVVDEVTINPYTPMQWDGGIGPMMATRPMPANTITLSGGLPDYSYAIVLGELPTGITLNPDTGVLAGTPLVPGPYAFTIRVTDGLGQTADLLQTGSVVENLVLDYTATKQGTVGVALSTPAVRTGGTAPFVFEATSPLPPGLSLNPSSGQVSGTPTAASGAVTSFQVTDANGFTATDSITFDIRTAPVIGGSFVRGMVGKAYSRTFSGTGGFTPYTFSATGLPTGLSINSGSGVVSGTPSVAGTFNARVTLTDALGNTSQTTLIAVEIAAALTIGGTYNTSLTRNIAYAGFTPTVSGGWAPRTFDISAGALPPGLTLNAGTGAITGTPTTQGSYTATLRVTDADGSTATMSFNVDVAGDMAITGSVPTRGTTTVAFTGDNLGVTGGTGPYTWSIQAFALPGGLSLNTSTGDISGTPTQTGTFTPTIRVTDAAGGWVQQNYIITVAAYPTLTGNLPDASQGVAYSAQLSRAGGHSPFTFDISAGALPTGLNINASNGTVSGTPSAAGTFNFTVRVTDDAGNIATRADSIAVTAVPVISGDYTSETEAPYASGVDPSAYSSSVSVTGGKAPISWTLAGGTLPPGLTLNGGTGTISGTTQYVSEASGLGYTDYSFTVRATDANGQSDTISDSIRLYWHVIKNNPGGYATPTQGVAYSSTITGGYGKAPYTYSVVSGTLPTGLTLGSGTGTLSGTPSVNGSFPLTFRITDALGKSNDWTQTLVVNPPAAISGNSPNGTASVGYSFTYTRSGGNGVYSFALIVGSLPPGLTLNSSGQITGTPTTPGTYNYTVQVTSAGSTASVADSIQINAFPTLTLNYGRGMVGKAYSGTVTAGSGWTPYAYSLVSGALPTGLALNSSTGALSGTPSVAGTYNFTIRLTDALGNIVNRAGSIAIANAMSLPTTYATPANEDVAYSSTVTASGGWSPYSYAVIAGAIPTGTTLGASTGTISGTPPTPGTYNFTIRATDADGSTVDKAFSIVINATAVALSISATPNPARDSAFSNGSPVTAIASSTVTATGGSGVYTSYTWAKVGDGGSGGDFSTSLSNGNRTLTCSRTGSFNYEEWEIWRCTVTDSLGATAFVNVTFELFIHDNR